VTAPRGGAYARGAMSFLYGDSTPSPLTSNFLEFLRDAIDFAVLVLQADDAIAAIQDRLRSTSHASLEEVERLESFGRMVGAAIEQAPKGQADSETSRCATQLAAAADEYVRVAIAAVRDKLAADRAQLAAEEASQRDACFKALEGLLLRHIPPNAAVTLHLERSADRGYTAWQTGESEMGLTWRIELSIPKGSAFAGESPMDRLASHVEVQAPDQGGWLKKEVRTRAQRLDRLVLVAAEDDGQTVTLRLRADPQSAQGLDLAVEPATGTVRARRTGVDDDLSVGPFELPPDDMLKVVNFADNVRTAARELEASRLAEATLRDEDFRQQPVFADAVQSLVSLMAPIVREVARHSLTPTELVLRRLLSSERREEIFVTRSTLRDKYQSLRPELHGLFEGLGLDDVPPSRTRSSVPATLEENDWPPAPRSELPRSDPPPPLLPSSPPPRSA
jgi:hypothetical protein